MTTAAKMPEVYIKQPINIEVQPEQKKPDSLPPGANLYNDIFNTYRTFEQLYIFSEAPLTYFAGACVGVTKGTLHYWDHGAPKKIAQDGEMNDFGAKVHTSEFLSLIALFVKRFGLGVIPATKVDRIIDWAVSNKTEEITNIGATLKHGYIAYKAAQLGDELIQRLANWIDVPVK